MKTMPIEEAAKQLAELIANMDILEGVYLTMDGQIVAHLERVGKSRTGPPQLGAQPGSILYMADDFDAPMDFVDSKE
jgi:hypothetical protein